MTLTFHETFFVLQMESRNAFIAPIANGKWLKNATNTAYKTKDIIEAARFRNYADSKAENIFTKLMLKTYPIPAGGPISPKDLTLLPFQRERGIPHILSGNRKYIAHQPGLGKSAQAICAVNTCPGQALIICPSFLKTTWCREITKWSANDFPTIAVVPESAKQLEMNWSADFVICSDAMLLRDWVRTGIYRTKFRHIYIDEGHRFKEPTSSRTTALFGGVNGKMKSPGLIYKADFVCVLSGTPMLNTPIDLWPVLFAMAPEVIDFMSYHDFGFRYCGAFQDQYGQWHFKGSDNEDELNKKIMGRFMQRIRKDEVLTDLPDKVREVIVMNEDPRTKDVRAMDFELTKTLNLDLIDKPSELGEYAELRHEIGMSKVPWVSNYIYSLLESDRTEQIILFAHHRDVVAELHRLLFMFKPMVINGGVTNERRTEVEDLFQSKKRRLIIGNIDAMNLGITLTAATRIVFAEYSWTPAANEQAEDRAHRIGQLDCVLCQYIVLPNSLDEIVLNAVLEKEDSIERVIG